MPGKGLSLRFLLIVSVIYFACLIPASMFGWRGIYSSFCLVIFTTIVLRRQYKVLVFIVVLAVVSSGTFGQNPVPYLAMIIVAVATVFSCVVWQNRSLQISVLLLLVFLTFLAGSLYGVRPVAYESMNRHGCLSNLKLISWALIQYEIKHGRLPPAYTINAKGEPLHCWRTLILPELGYSKLYDEIDLSLPWDHPRNQRFHNRMPEVFTCQKSVYQSKWWSIGSTTPYVVVIGKNTAWPEPGFSSQKQRLTLKQISDLDGPLTGLVVESEPHRSHWMDPNSPKIGNFKEGCLHQRCWNMACVDGSCHSVWDVEDFLDSKTATIKNLFLINDGI